MSSESRWSLRSRALVVGALAAIALARVATAWQRAASWDFRAHAADPLDGAWRLELAWQAARGHWSYLDFHYPRGPLWQAVAGGAYGLAGGDAGGTHALTALLFELLALAALAYVALRRVRRPRFALAAVVALGALSSVVGAATLRAALPLLVADALVPREGEAPSWRGPALAATWTWVSALISFDRLYAALITVAALFVVELIWRLRARASPRVAALRLARFFVCFTVGLVALAAIAAALGGDPLEAVAEQRRLATDYAAAMTTGWEARVPAWLVAGYALACAACALTPAVRAEERPPIGALLVAAATPGLLFAIVRSDEEHVALAALPGVAALVVAALREDASLGWRASAGALGALAIGAWALAHPSTLAVSPFAGARGPDPSYQSPHRAAVEWARGLPPGDCVGASADMAVVHAMADRPGPTELPLRWTHARELERARAIARAACPRFVYSAYTFVWPGNAWVLGPDFVEVARRYRLERPLGVSLFALELRERPRAVERTRLASDALDREVDVPGVARVPLGDVVRGTDVIELEITLDVPSWRRALGGAPGLEWRFERGGEPVSGWVSLVNVALGEPTRVQLSPDPAAVEWAWIAGRAPSRMRGADTLALRASPRGAASPGSMRVRVGAIERVRIPLDDPQPAGCAEDVGPASVRHASARPTADGLTIAPNPPDDYLAEAWFPARPCASACFTFDARLEATEDGSDGVELAVEVFDPPQRSEPRYVRLTTESPEAPFSLALDGVADRGVWLGVRVAPWEHARGDRVHLGSLRVGACGDSAAP